MYAPDSDSEGSDHVAVATSVNPSPSQIQAGYNSFGRPSMFAQQSSLNAASGGNNGSYDDSDDDNNVVVARPAPRGKELRLSGVSLPEADSSDDEDDNKDQPTPEVTSISSNPQPRGKVLRLPPPRGNDDSSSDDEPLSNLKSKNASRKRKEAPNAGDSDSDDDDVVAATVVEGGDANDVMAVAKVITSNKKSKTNDGKAKKASAAKKTPTKKKKASPAKKGAKSAQPKALEGFPPVPADKAEAAQKARTKLRKCVASLPFEVSENQIIRSFGKIIAENGNQLDDTQYSSPSSIHPVGFSCDRKMFSPIHNRIITLRCDILDGKKDTGVEPALVDEESSNNACTGGPIFRIVWGEGIEQDDLMESCSFDAEIASEYTVVSKKIKPSVGMRVNVDIGKFNAVAGVITKAKAPAKSGKNKGLSVITIKYEDGVTEDTLFPDPDIHLAPPGCPPINVGTSTLTEMNGKLIRVVSANSPLEAWGKTLLSLGLIDEIMLDDAMVALQASRNEGFNEAKEKVDAINRKRREDRAKINEERRRSNRDSPSKYRKDDDATMSTEGAGSNGDVNKADISSEKDHESKVESSGETKEKGSETLPETDRVTTQSDSVNDKKEAPSSEESVLRDKMNELQKELLNAKNQAKKASVDLANIRIASISPFALNPFVYGGDSTATEMTWMANAVKKERTKMGASGKKKKVVKPTSMMERNDTFFLPKTERLVEGLPGAEYTPSYVFHANRSASSDNSWVHEAKLKHQKQRQKKEEKKKKVKKLSETKAKTDREKEAKKRLRDEETALRKRQRDEEEELKKQTRIEKRLAQLNIQMDDKLFKEALVARERHLQNFVRGMNKEYNRRRKAAEVVVGNKLEHSKFSASASASSVVAFREMLPRFSRQYDEEVVRIWDFIHSFSGALKDSTQLSNMPSLDTLQDAVDSLKSIATCTGNSRTDAVQLMKSIAITLCTVISPSLTKTLSSSIPNIDTIGVDGVSDGPQKESDVSCLPVNEWTWREIARMIIVWDVLTDIGCSKSEASNIVKGYRSGGHPNSKEAKRWKKIEDSIIFMMYQQLNSHDSSQYRRRLVTTCMSTPCVPSSVPSDWHFHLHNIKSRSSSSLLFVKENVEKSLSALRDSAVEGKEGFIKDLEKCLSALKQAGTCASELIKVKEMVITVLDRADEKREVSESNSVTTDHSKTDARDPKRQKMGLLQLFKMTREQYKMSESAKEEYMAAALRLKEKLEMKDTIADDDDDKSDDEEDGNTKSEEKTSKDDDAQKNGASAANMKPNGKAESMHANGHPTINDREAELPSEVADGFPDGWVTRRIPRNNVNDPRMDRYWYSPKLGLKFRNKDDAKRFLNKLNDANGDESEAIIAFHGRKRGRPSLTSTSAVAAEYDFCGDIASAPDFIRRCLAVVRTLCASASASPFIYPVDPQVYPAYYEAVMTPCSLYDVGTYLQEVGKRLSSNHDDPEVEDAVANTGRKIRIIIQNSIYVNSSNSVVNSAEEMSRIFERLFFDWVLAPSSTRPALEDLDDDKCIDPHESDMNNMVLLCDGCEAKYNMLRLKPPIHEVPKGDWYCPRCITGRSWTTTDPRIGRKVKNDIFYGVIQSCKFVFVESAKPSLSYCVKDFYSGRKEYWSLGDVDKWIVGDPVDPISCFEALSESPGYGFGRDSGSGVSGELPLPFNPLVADNAAQAALSSSVFQNSIAACVSLANPPEELRAEEWTTLLTLLVEKCASSDGIAEFANEIEGKENARQSAEMLSFWRSRGAKNIVPDVSDDEDSISSSEGEEISSPSVVENSNQVANSSAGPASSSSEAGDAKVSNSSSEDARSEIEKDSITHTNELCKEQSLSTASSNEVVFDAELNEEEVRKKKEQEEAEAAQKKREQALVLAKTRREKKREEALIGFLVGNRLKSVAASFEEDILSTIVENSLCKQEEGLNLQAVRCRESCHYCGLPDLALGAPLVRVPDDDEWKELFPYAVHERNTYMVAAVPKKSVLDDKLEDGMDIDADENKQFLSVRVRVGGELVSSKADNSKNYDQAMQQFLPKNPIGFQSELRFRNESNLPFLSGSLSAHEVCAMAAQKSRKDNFLRDRKDAYKDYLMKGAAMACGKSTPLGLDRWGRSYWVFSAEPKSLFICETVSPSDDDSASPTKKWYRFGKPEEIASVIIGLRKDDPCDALKEVFGEAVELVKNRSWSTLLFARRHVSADKEAEASSGVEKAENADQGEDNGPPFVEDEDVLVESEDGSFLWDAVIVDVKKEPQTGRVNSYLVHYKNWNSRYDQWVKPDRVVEPSKNNLEVQDEVFGEYSAACNATPDELKGMFAFQYFDAKKRAKGKTRTAFEVFDCVPVGKHGSHNEMLLGLLKGALLMIEAALPRGSVVTDEDGHWNPESAALWRSLVKSSLGPETLMRCILVLEDAISPEWYHEQATQLYAAIPKQFKAMGGASLSAIALRISILDRCLKYQKIA